MIVWILLGLSNFLVALGGFLVGYGLWQRKLDRGIIQYTQRRDDPN